MLSLYYQQQDFAWRCNFLMVNKSDELPSLLSVLQRRLKCHLHQTFLHPQRVVWALYCCALLGGSQSPLVCTQEPTVKCRKKNTRKTRRHTAHVVSSKALEDLSNLLFSQKIGCSLPDSSRVHASSRKYINLVYMLQN